MPRREADALRRHEVHEGIVRLGQIAMHRLHHLLGRMRPRHREHLGMSGQDDVVLRPEAAGHDDPPVLAQRLADRIERLLDRGVDEAAGVYHDEVGILVAPRNLVALGAEPGQNVLGVHRRLGATEGDEADAGRVRREC